MRFFVIPAEAGIQYFRAVKILWIPVFTGMTTFYDSIKYYFHFVSCPTTPITTK
jgi:hypothetical protein